jgi:carbon starvation protein CstA
MMFGWLPTLIWILLGAIFIGGIHDFGSLVASIRHKARSIAEVVREHMTRRSYILFLTFVWIALIYIIVAFTDIVAGSFVGNITLENGQTVRGAGIATSSLLYLALPLVMAFVLEIHQVYQLLAVTLIFLPLVVARSGSVNISRLILAAWLGLSRPRGAKSLGRCSPYILFHRCGGADVDLTPTARASGRLLPVRGADRGSARRACSAAAK